MAYRTDKFATGDSISWTDQSRALFAPQYGEGPFVITKVDEEDSFMWPLMGHSQFVHFEGSEYSLFSGYHFNKVEVKNGPSEEEIRAIAMTEIARRLELAKLALLQVDFDYDLRKGFISSDTMQTVTRALELLK